MKLYKLEIRMTAYVWASDEQEARRHARDVAASEASNLQLVPGAHKVAVSEVQATDTPSSGWEEGCLVYGDHTWPGGGSQEIRLEQVWPGGLR